MEIFRAVALMAATMTMGISAGVFQLYSVAIMPGLRRTDDNTFVTAFQQIDKAIVGPFLLVFFIGPLLFAALAGGLRFGADDRTELYWIISAFVLFLAVAVITIAVNVPLNDDIKAAGDPAGIADISTVRERFHEVRWASWNIVRSVATTVAFGCLAWALVLHGRS